MSSIVFAIVGTPALAVCVLCLSILHLVPSGVQPVRDPVSLYGTTRYHILYRVQARASGLCAVAFTAIAIAVGLLTGSLVTLTLWNELRVVLLIAEYLTIISAILFLFISLLSSLRRFTGLFERGIYLGALCWLGLTIIPLIH